MVSFNSPFIEESNDTSLTTWLAEHAEKIAFKRAMRDARATDLLHIWCTSGAHLQQISNCILNALFLSVWLIIWQVRVHSIPQCKTSKMTSCWNNFANHMQHPRSQPIFRVSHSHRFLSSFCVVERIFTDSIHYPYCFNESNDTSLTTWLAPHAEKIAFKRAPRDARATDLLHIWHTSGAHLQQISTCISNALFSLCDAHHMTSESPFNSLMKDE